MDRVSLLAGGYAIRAKHGRHCSCTPCSQEDWTRVSAPCGIHGPSCPPVYDPRPLLYFARTTLVEEYHFDPEQIRQDFGDALDAWEGSFEDFVIDLFEEHDGSNFHGKFFYNDANPQYGVELIERYDNE